MRHALPWDQIRGSIGLRRALTNGFYPGQSPTQSWAPRGTIVGIFWPYYLHSKEPISVGGID